MLTTLVIVNQISHIKPRMTVQKGGIKRNKRLKICKLFKVAVEDVELSTLTRKLDKEAIYTIIIAVVVGLVIIAVIIALASWLCFLRKKSEHSGIKIKRIDRNGQTLNSSKHPARSVKRLAH